MTSRHLLRAKKTLRSFASVMTLENGKGNGLQLARLVNHDAKASSLYIGHSSSTACPVNLKKSMDRTMEYTSSGRFLMWANRYDIDLYQWVVKGGADYATNVSGAGRKRQQQHIA